MKQVRFKDKIIILSNVILIEYYEDEREEEARPFDWLRERFVFYFDSQESGFTQVIFHDEPGFEAFKDWFFRQHKVDGHIYDDDFNWREAEERTLSE